VLISGEAGIGKSRLTAEFLERLPGEPHTRLRYFCSPQHTDSALHPIIGHIERAANFAREDDAKMRLDKLEAVLSRSSMSNEDAALLAQMLSLPNDGRYPALDLAPHQRRQRTLAALARRIEGIARETPVLMAEEFVRSLSQRRIGRTRRTGTTLPPMTGQRLSQNAQRGHGTKLRAGGSNSSPSTPAWFSAPFSGRIFPRRSRRSGSCWTVRSRPYRISASTWSTYATSRHWNCWR
jgi:hypothetical protein